MPLLGGHAIPIDGFSVVLRDSITVSVHLAETELRLRVPFFSKKLDNFDCGCVVSALKGIDAVLEVLPEEKGRYG